MSWYRRLERISMLAQRNLISMPLVENPPGASHMTYMDIGHSRFDANRSMTNNRVNQPDEEYLWAILPDLELEVMDAATPSEWFDHETQEGPQSVAHEEAFMLMDDFDEDGQQTYMAKGRYSKSSQHPEGVISLILHPDVAALKIKNPRRYEYVTGQVIGILEKNWGNGVRIMQFF